MRFTAIDGASCDVITLALERENGFAVGPLANQILTIQEEFPPRGDSIYIHTKQRRATMGLV